MTARRIDGKTLSAQVRTEVAARAAALTASGRQPALAVILVGGDPASQVYVRNKIAACKQAGIRSIHETYGAELREGELLARIHALNQDDGVHGILVQLPLPPHINAQRVIEAISPRKDVDGFHVANAGALMVGQPGFRPCTPLGCMRMLEHVGMSNLRGKHAVVVGRSNIVGKPMALMLLGADATVTIAHSGTPDLAATCRQADVLVAAAGKPRMITGSMIKPGAVVIDVGINRLPDGTLCGDVDFASAEGVADWITPVPGGVGPMTIAMLLANTVQACEQY
ncbi:bifunctional methylenetetrahydrofolate dehydrogenase/methenyltetrahydrofolate cyclohydrolase FolD [Thiomonas sp. FB-Cd]|uniref:bifunctional methylenetetrahydrofolate dehydrogenase/methenyltetrahydrofolate cyclohydrolase FolD n=1 Tax=Thiomonas sp. FB-Cd TaxID=1158292 RepID=UPI0004DF47F7|nr:bifunctional methylenetetrahydrofolate dehydrogenase/methenyltetrahydrofolate cyclohydrolase FolD [Thiomonas sp. FB-Cd]